MRRYLADADVDPLAPERPYKQLAAILRARVARGDWEPNHPMLSEAKLGKEYGLSRSTVRRTIHLLVDEGVLFVVPQAGTYVTEHGQHIAEIRQQLAAQGNRRR